MKETKPQWAVVATWGNDKAKFGFVDSVHETEEAALASRHPQAGIVRSFQGWTKLYVGRQVTL